MQSLEVSDNMQKFTSFFRRKFQVVRKDDRGKFLSNAFKCYTYLSFGDYNNPTLMNFGNLQGLVEYDIQQGETLQQNHHSGMEILTFVVGGQLRQDNYTKENIQIKQGECIVLQTQSSDETNWHRESNSGVERLCFLQMFIKNDEQKQSDACHIKSVVVDKFDESQLISSCSKYTVEQLTLDVESEFLISNQNGLVVLCFTGSIDVHFSQEKLSLCQRDLLYMDEQSEVSLKAIERSELFLLKYI